MSTILIVDDEKSIRLTFTLFLQKEGHTVYSAENAQLALSLFQSHPIDLVITDIVMPKISGIDLTKEIGLLNRNVPIIIMTGDPSLETAKNAIKEHVYDYVIKPINKDTLLKTTSNALKHKALIDSKRRLEEENVAYRQQLEKALLDQTKSLDTMNMIIDFSPIPTCIIHEENLSILLHNQAMANLLGKSFEPSMPITNFIGEDDYLNVDEIYTSLTYVSNQEIQIKTSDQLHRWVMLNMRSITYMDTKSILMTLVDLDELKNTQMNLMKAKITAEEAAKLKADFLANMSHEIRTPMNAVLGLNDLLESTPLNPEQRNYVDKIKESGKWLLAVINDILDFSKIESGKLNVENIPTDVRDCLTSAVGAITPKANQKHLILRHFVDDELPSSLYLDPFRLGQILRNLIDNAVKFTHEGEVTIRVSKETSEDQPNNIRFTITDTGIGMTSSQIDQLFQPFTQGDSSTTRKYGGTGLGLIITKRLVELMDGQLTISSQVNQGSTFSFTLPLIAVKPTFTTYHPQKSEPSTLMNVLPAKGYRILLVEDNELNRLVICGLLENEGFHVDIAIHGECAVRRAKTTKFDLILMDLQMPYLDGYETTAVLRKMTDYQTIPIIALSADVMSGTKKKVIEAGMTDYISKPINKNDLLKVIAKWYKPGTSV